MSKFQRIRCQRSRCQAQRSIAAAHVVSVHIGRARMQIRQRIRWMAFAFLYLKNRLKTCFD